MALPMREIFRCGCGSFRRISPILSQRTSVQWYCQKLDKESEEKRHPEKELRPPSGWSKFTIDKYTKFVSWYEVKLENKYPKAFSIYKLFKDGISEFFTGVKIYTSVSADIWTGTELDKFTRHQLEIYRQMPRDMLKVAPVLIISALPLANYVIFPVAYFFPRHLLSRQFWTPEQRLEFPLQDLKHRVDHYHTIFNAMKVNSKHITHPLYKRYMETIIEKLDSKSHPEVQEILDAKPLFEYGAYQLDKLTITYSRHLSRSMLMPYRRWKLWQESFLLHHIDKAMLKEGIDKLTDVELQQSCLMRGLNPKELSRDDMTTFLKKWAAVSSSLNEDNQSLLLHLPIMLSLHHQNNVKLYKKRRRDQ